MFPDIKTWWEIQQNMTEKKGEECLCRWHSDRRVSVCCSDDPEEQKEKCKYFLTASNHVSKPEFCAYWRRQEDFVFNGWRKCSHYLAQQEAQKWGKYNVKGMKPEV